MEKKQQVMELWRKNFQDPEDFIQFYFNKKYSDEDSLVYEENNQALSSLLMLPYPMTCLGVNIATSYISGACTIPEARNQGLMPLLLAEALVRMHKKQIAISTLIPAEAWLFDYYRKWGYVSVFDYSIETYDPVFSLDDSSIQVISPEDFTPAFSRNTFSFFDQAMHKRPCCIQHPLEDYMAIIEETYRCGGRLLVAYQNQNICGWALIIPEAKNILVNEIVYKDKKEKLALFSRISQIWPNNPIHCKRLPNGGRQMSYGMARIIDARHMLQQFAQQNPALTLSIQLHDPQLPINEGIYKISQGMCSRTEISNSPVDAETDIPTLTRALLGYHPEQLPFPFNQIFPPQQPFMNLMLD